MSLAEYRDDDVERPIPWEAGPSGNERGAGTIAIQELILGSVATATVARTVVPYLTRVAENWLLTHRLAKLHDPLFTTATVVSYVTSFAENPPLTYGPAKFYGRLFNVATKSTGWSAIAEDIVSELGRLTHGWAGPGTVPPSEEVVNDIERVVGCLSPTVRRPSVEVDDETGHVTLSWLSEDQRRMFSLLFAGNDEVIGSFTSLIAGETERPWRHNTKEENKIVAALDSERTRAVLST
jgi:hypothetical protein